MSRFWDKAESSSESDGGSESDSLEEVQNQRTVGSKFQGAFESDSESDDEKRVVKSQKDRAWDTMQESIGRIRNAKKNGDWSVILDEFEKVNKMIDKAKMLIMQNGVPLFYIRMLGELEDFLASTHDDKEGLKKMKPTMKKSFERMKLNLKKHNKTYEKDIADFRANPGKYAEAEVEESSDEDEESSEESSEEGDSEDEDSDSEDEAPKKTKAAKASDSDSDSLFGESDSDESTDSEKEGDGRQELKGRAKWLKKVVDPNAPKSKDRGIKRDKGDKEKGVAGKVRTYEAAKKVAVEEEVFTEELLDKKLAELLTTRGRKGSDKKAVVLHLEHLVRAARKLGPKKEIPLLMHLVAAIFDSHRNIDDYVDIQKWGAVHHSLTRIVDMLLANPELVLGVAPLSDVTEQIQTLQLNADFIKKDEEPEEEEAPVDANVVKVVGSLEAFLLRLEGEYKKSLQQINPHSNDYALRLADETLLIELAEQLFVYYSRGTDTRVASTMGLMSVEHMYYKHDTIAVAVHRSNAFSKVFGRYSDLHPASLGMGKEAVESTDPRIAHPGSFSGTPYLQPSEYNPSLKMEQLCKYIFKYGDDRSRTRALLCSVYYHALHDRYFMARDMFLISHVQETIEKTDTDTQILYNRALVTLGMSAFRLGLIQKAHESLGGICSGRVRDLLAQGHSKYFEKDPEQEKMERRRQMPYHMHINPDLLEYCHLISAMLLELPQLSRPAVAHMIISKQFRKYMNSYRQQMFTGPPENTRDFVMAASKCLLAGDWKKACQMLLSNDVWNLIPGDACEKVKDMLRQKIKEEAIRIFILNYGTHYESISLAHICTMFEMDEASSRKIVSKMIHHKEISGAWEQPADVLVLYKVEPSPLQALCQVVSDKVATLVESNERLLDNLAGVYGYKDDGWSNRDARGKYGQYGDATKSKNGSFKGQGNYNKYPPARVGGQGRGGRGGRGAYGRDGARPRSQGYQQSADKQARPSQSKTQQSSGGDVQHSAKGGQFRWGNA